MVDEVRASLGDFPNFRKWKGRTNLWGPEDRWKVWLGGDVVDGVCDLLNGLVTSSRAPHGRHDWTPCVLGVSPWLTHSRVVDRLLALPTCIVMDKGAARTRHARRLATMGKPFPNAHPTLVDRAPMVGGRPFIVSSQMPEYELGPVRVIGWNTGRRSPMAHAKALLFAEMLWYEDDELFAGDRWLFRPVSVWWGSANLTEASAGHLEVGCWSDDPKIVEHFAAFIGDVIASSEPFDSTSPAPQPDLLRVEFDADVESYAGASEYWEDDEAR